MLLVFERVLVLAVAEVIVNMETGYCTIQLLNDRNHVGEILLHVLDALQQVDPIVTPEVV